MTRHRRLLRLSLEDAGLVIMNTAEPFEMKIVELFRFADHRTVFVGPIHGAKSFIGPCRCDLVIDGNVFHTVTIEGEMIADREPPNGHRALSTLDNVSLDINRVGDHSYLLVHNPQLNSAP